MHGDAEALDELRVIGPEHPLLIRLGEGLAQDFDAKGLGGLRHPALRAGRCLDHESRPDTLHRIGGGHREETCAVQAGYRHDARDIVSSHEGPGRVVNRHERGSRGRAKRAQPARNPVARGPLPRGEQASGSPATPRRGREAAELACGDHGDHEVDLGRAGQRLEGMREQTSAPRGAQMPSGSPSAGDRRARPRARGPQSPWIRTIAKRKGPGALGQARASDFRAATVRAGGPTMRLVAAVFFVFVTFVCTAPWRSRENRSSRS